MLDLFEDYVKNSDQEKMIEVDIDLDDGVLGVEFHSILKELVA